MTQPEAPEAQVVSVDAGGRKRVHFAGLLEDAEQYVYDHFPRPHVEPGSNQSLKADVHVETGGTRVAWHGKGSGGSDGWHPVDEQGNIVEATPTAPEVE